MKDVAPTPRKNTNLAEAYEALQKHGPMTRQQLKMTTGLDKAKLFAALDSGVYRGYFIRSELNHRYALAPASTHAARKPVREADAKRSGLISVEVGPSAVARIRRLVKVCKKTNPEANQASVVRRALLEMERSLKAPKKPVAVVVAPAKPWWKIW